MGRHQVADNRKRSIIRCLLPFNHHVNFGNFYIFTSYLAYEAFSCEGANGTHLRRFSQATALRKRCKHDLFWQLTQTPFSFNSWL